MERRNILRGLLGLVCLGSTVTGNAHTPYNQWQVYRQKHLLIGCHKDDEETYALAGEVVNIFDTLLPEARARVARAPTARRIASLLATAQMDMAIMSVANAQDMTRGQGAFQPYGSIPLRLVFPIRNKVLVSRADIPDRHAWLVTDALLEALEKPVSTIEFPPRHTGSQLRLDEKPMPHG